MRLACILMLLVGVAGAQLPGSFRLSKAVVDSNASYMLDTSSTAGIASNSVVDIRAAGDSLVFFGTSRGLSLTPDLGSTFRSYIDTMVNLPIGSISAMTVSDSIVIAAALSDSVIAGTAQLIGAGLAYSRDMGDTWTYLDVPREPEDSPATISFLWGGNTIDQLAITTIVNNVTWDLAYSLGTLWAASWSSGLRRFPITASGTKWQVVPMPRDNDDFLSCDSIPEGYMINPRNPNDAIDPGNHNHKGFSVIAYDTLVWVGTAGGINKGIVDSTNGCIDWTHYTAQNSNISGNWVVALHRQVWSGGERIWASTVQAEGVGEIQGLSYTDNAGESWRTALLGIRVHNISSFGATVYAATADGLYKSPDGVNWVRFLSAVDSKTGERVYADIATGALYDSRDSTLWVGTPDGLARTSDEGATWAVERAFVSTQGSDDRFYAYPNPFSPATDNILDGSGYVRFQYHIEAGEAGKRAAIEIFDFAMDPVTELAYRTHGAVGDYSQAWDGRNSAGFSVANGVYYCRLKIGTTGYWTKVVVIN